MILRIGALGASLSIGASTDACTDDVSFAEFVSKFVAVCPVNGNAVTLDGRSETNSRLVCSCLHC